MKNLGKFYKSQNHLRPVLLLATALLALSGSGIPSAASAQDTSSPQTTTSSQKVQLMFVQTAEDLKVNPTEKTLRLVNVGQQTLYFSDRPQRVAGHLTMPAYLDEWTAGEGPDNFANDPPNATLSVYEPGRQDNTLVVVEISHPVIDGKDLVYKYKLIEGKMPKSGGAAALFIDWIGAGGGAGPGFHGVGAGTRGVGLTGGYGGPLR
jgi:hypothetical protein